MNYQKKQMQEAAILYYEKNQTQSEIAKIMKLSRQTVSKILGDAIKEKVVEIKIYNPDTSCAELEEALCERFSVKKAIVCGVSCDDESLCSLMTVRGAADYVKTLAAKGNLKIGVSWGRTVQSLISELSDSAGEGNTVFPLFGATEQGESYFLSNEIARSFADKIGARVKYAWFPYKPDTADDGALFKKTSYYNTLKDLWAYIDVALVGIGNTDIIDVFGKSFGYNERGHSAVGDISTHFFDSEGNFLKLYENTLCASVDNIRGAKETVAVASGKNKAKAIAGALRTGVVDTIITDEYTAKRILTDV